MASQPLPAGVEKGLALAQVGLAALPVADPFHAFGGQQQVHVVGSAQQLLFDPRRAIAEQGAAPEQVAQQVRIKNQQAGQRSTCSVFPGQLTLSNGRNITVGGIAALLIDEVTHVLADQNPAEPTLYFGREPALAARFRAGQDQDFHRASTRSLRHSRQPCTASRVNSAYNAAVR